MSTRALRRGFTIVELLIVIVVIALLAAISIVAYNGIQNRAQRSVLQANLKNTMSRIEVFNAENGTYPQSISDCPSPSPQSLCLSWGIGMEGQYKRNVIGSDIYMRSLVPSYEVAVLAEKQFLYRGSGEKTSNNEFMQYVDLAPFIDTYGIRKYELSFDIKTALTSASSVSVYFQNGSGSRYSGLSKGVAVQSDYQRHTIVFTPVLNHPSITQAMLAFYGVYDTGNRPTVTNVEFQLAS